MDYVDVLRSFLFHGGAHDGSSSIVGVVLDLKVLLVLYVILWLFG